ncbi:hypothetical protein StoSoilB5_07710 [Arthrobacter sp. StoSoilB5]|nr:hypothetical protein StoSoilB5_07710 [Arthrobacter sp. StoSoilB5]
MDVQWALPSIALVRPVRGPRNPIREQPLKDTCAPGAGPNQGNTVDLRFSHAQA